MNMSPSFQTGYISSARMFALWMCGPKDSRTLHALHLWRPLPGENGQDLFNLCTKQPTKNSQNKSMQLSCTRTVHDQ